MGPVENKELPVKRVKTTPSTTPIKSFHPKLVMNEAVLWRRVTVIALLYLAHEKASEQRQEANVGNEGG